MGSKGSFQSPTSCTQHTLPVSKTHADDPFGDFRTTAPSAAAPPAPSVSTSAHAAHADPFGMFEDVHGAQPAVAAAAQPAAAVGGLEAMDDLLGFPGKLGQEVCSIGFV